MDNIAVILKHTANHMALSALREFHALRSLEWTKFAVLGKPSSSSPFLRTVGQRCYSVPSK